jgi:hypothetical protein
MAEFCPDELAQARHTAASALLAGVSQVAAADRPQCTSITCGADLANDKLGKDVICSCAWECHQEESCCDGFQAACPDAHAQALNATNNPRVGKGKAGKAGKGLNKQL